MKKLFLFSCLMISSLATVAQLGVAISQTTTTPDQSAILDVQSTSKGMLIEQAGTGDAWFNIGLSGAKNYAFGLDNSDNDKFKIGYNANGPSGLHVTGAINPAGGISSSGNIKVNSITGYISFTAGGSEIRLYANGHIDITAGGNLNISAGGDLSLSGNNVILESSGSMSIESSAAMGINATGSMDITSGNTMDVINSGGTMSVRNLGGTLNVNSISTLNLDGAIVDLNNGTNGAARLFDPVSGGIIVSGSTTVKIGN